MNERWIIACDCAGHPEELVGVIEVNAGKASVWSTGRGGGGLSTKGANRLLLSATAEERAELIRKIRTREIPLRATVTFSHAACGKSIRVTESGLGELLSAVSKAVTDHRVSLALLCAVNSRLQRGATR